MKSRFFSILFLLTITISCTSPETESFNSDAYWGENPWPEIRIERINQLLPKALENANVDCWLVICRENNNDPIADHIGGENAGGTAVFCFIMMKLGFTLKYFPHLVKQPL
jgi:hypothetical protein